MSSKSSSTGEREETRRQWWRLTGEETLRVLGRSDHGLSDDEAKKLLARYGPNELAQGGGLAILPVIVRQFTSPLIYILIIAAVVTLALGEYIDTGIIVAVLALNATLGTLQEYRVEQSMEALRQVASARAHVMRGGRDRELDARELVLGDIVIVEAGSKVPADCRLLFSAGPMTSRSAAPFQSDEAAPPCEKSQYWLYSLNVSSIGFNEFATSRRLALGISPVSSITESECIQAIL